MTAPHLPTALAVLAVVAVVALLVLLYRRRSRPQGFISVGDQATYETLHTAALAARHLADGLTDDGCARAAPYLRALVATPALAICDHGSVITWEGEGGTTSRRSSTRPARRWPRDGPSCSARRR